VRPPVSDVDFQQEVSGYGMPGFKGDMNDDWILEIDDGVSSDRDSYKRLRTLHTRFKLRHALTGCYLFSHKVKLPDWGFEQQEVTCNKNAVHDNSIWIVETNTNPLRTPYSFICLYKLTVLLCSAGGCGQGQLPPAQLPFQVPRAAASHVDDESGPDRASCL
jgi:dolichyl-phosphate-mannose-protein mannosyltransferase